MADIVINHRIGTTQGHGGIYNRYDGIPLAWNEHAVTSCTGGLALWPFPSNHIMEGYAYILTHPGIPTVFYDHFYDCGDSIHEQIVKLMEIRSSEDIHSRSAVRILEAQDNLYSAIIGEKICMKVGDGTWCPTDGEWTLATRGQRYAVW